MLAVNHDVLRAFNEVRSDDIEIITTNVLEKAKKEGVKLTKVQARTAVQNVDQFLLKAKADELGKFTERSATVQPRKSFLKTPEFWKDILNLLDGSSHEECLIVSLCDQQNFDLYKCDLMISSEDLNTCDFRKQLGRCLLKDQCVIYFDVSTLTIRGNERLVVLLRDFKKLFDNRVLLILFTSGILLPSGLTNLTELSLMCPSVNSANKKRKISNSVDDFGSSDLKKKIKQLQENLSLSGKEVSILKSELEEKVAKEKKLKEEMISIRKETDAKDDACMSDIKEQKMKVIELEQIIVDLKSKNKALEKQFKEYKSTSVAPVEESRKNKVVEQIIVDLKSKNEALEKQVKEYNSTSVATVEESRKNKVVECAGGNSDKESVKSPAENIEHVSNRQSKNLAEHSLIIDDTLISRDEAVKLQVKISEIEKEFTVAGPLEILRRSLKTFEFDANFASKVHSKDLFVCTIVITEIDTQLQNYKQTKWVGEGRSKKLAKKGASVKLLDMFKSCD